MTSEEWDKASTVEGWAHYAAAVSWWNPNNTGSDPKISGYKIEKAAPHGGNCVLASRKGLQVAKGFWDLDDVNQEDVDGVGTGADNTSFATSVLLDFWGDFPEGGGDRGTFELNVNGANVWDYQFNAGLNSTQTTSFIHHNCLAAQAP